MTHDTNATGPGHDADRLSVSEAAARLGITPDAVRARIRRGTLEAVKVNGAYVVTLPRDTGPDTDTTAPCSDTTGLVDQLRSENAYLRDQLADMIRQAATERERADVLQREALHRLEALGPSVTAPPAAQDTDTGTDTETPQATLWGRLWRALRGS